MKKNIVKLNESQLHQVIAESVKRVVNEISLKTLDNAHQKSGGWNTYTYLKKDAGYGSRVYEAIRTIEDELEYYASKVNNRQAKELLSYLDPIRDFFNRKGEQALNFESSVEDEQSAAEREFETKSKEMFNKSVRELSDEEYDSVLSNCSPRTREYVDVFGGI